MRNADSIGTTPPRKGGVSPDGLARRHSRRIRRGLRHVSPFLRSLGSRPVTALLRYYGRSVSCPPGSSAYLQHELRLLRGQVSLIHATWSSSPSVSNHPCASHGRFRTLPLNSVGFPLPGLGFTTIWQARQSHRPNRVSYRTDGSFTSGCSPPRLATTQLPSVTGRRAFAWGGLSPP